MALKLFNTLTRKPVTGYARLTRNIRDYIAKNTQVVRMEVSK